MRRSNIYASVYRSCLDLVGTNRLILLIFILTNIAISKLEFGGGVSYEFVSTLDIVGKDYFFEIVEPTELQYVYRIRPAKDFGAPFNESYKYHEIALVPIYPSDGCSVPVNADRVSGNVVLVQRGICSFKKKALVAEEMGARAIIVTDENSEDAEIEMIDDSSVEDVHIPAAYLLGKNGYMIRMVLKQLKLDYAVINLPVNLTYTPINHINQPPWLQW